MKLLNVLRVQVLIVLNQFYAKYNDLRVCR